MKSLVVTLLGFTLLFSACAGSVPADRKRTKRSTTNQLGYVLPGYNFSIDADYNPRTAGFFSGYTSLTVAIVNKGFHAIRMRPDKDRWKVKDRQGRWHRGILEIQYEEPLIWSRLDPRAQKIMLYPEMVPPGYTQTFQIFIPGTVNLAGFDRIKYYNATAKKTFTFTRY